jgi:amidophosphoribosyltransferase
MARELGADSLRYLPVEAIARSVSLAPERLCRACITGNYPTPTGQYLYQIEASSPRHPTRRAYEPAHTAPLGS